LKPEYFKFQDEIKKFGTFQVFVQKYKVDELDKEFNFVVKITITKQQIVPVAQTAQKGQNEMKEASTTNTDLKETTTADPVKKKVKEYEDKDALEMKKR